MNTKYFRPAFWLAASVVLVSSLAWSGGYGGGGGSTIPVSKPVTFSSTLSGSSEAEPNMSTATGSGSTVVDSRTKALTAMVTTTGVVGMAAHIHEGAVGVSGPVIIPLTEMPAGSGKWSASVTLTNAQFTKLKAGGYYFNVHSTAYPAGEIRGQILTSGTRSGAGSGTGY